MKKLLIVALIGLTIPALAQKIYTPQPKSAERKALMDVLRPKAEKELGIKVIFEVTHLKVKGNWAMMTGVPRNTNGSAINYSKTKLKPEMDAWEDWICALYKKDAKTKKWKVVTWSMGGTDVSWYGWWEEHKAPRDIFPKSSDD